VAEGKGSAWKENKQQTSSRPMGSHVPVPRCKKLECAAGRSLKIISNNYYNAAPVPEGAAL